MKNGKGKSAFFTADAAIALGIVVLIALVGVTALAVNARHSDGRVWAAVRVADALANECAGSGGLTLCEGGYLRANEIGDETDLQKLSSDYSQRTGYDVTVFVGESTGGVCTHRLYLSGGAAVKAGACVK